MTVEPVRIAIVGLGFGASVQLPAFRKMPGVDVVAVVDPKGRQEPGLNRRSGVENCIRTWESIVQDPRIDAVSIAVPPRYQMEFVCEALRSGKHVLCEKPLGCGVDDAERMLRDAEMSGRIHSVDFQFRMESGIEAMKRVISEGGIGRLRHIDVVWMTEGGADHNAPWTWRNDKEQGGGVLGALGSHVIDYIQWLSKNSVEYVFAHGTIMVPQRRDSSGNMRNVTAEDSMDIFCILSEGITAVIKTAQCSMYSPGHRIEIYGSGGRLVYSHEKPFTPEKMSLRIENSPGGLRRIALDSPQPYKETDSRILPFSRLATLFVDAIGGEMSPDLPAFEQGYAVQQVMAAVGKSLASGKMEEVSREGKQQALPGAK